MKKIQAFTLLEMMITMSVFTISMLAILAVLSTSIGLIQKFYQGDNSRLQSDVFLAQLDAMSRESVKVTAFSSRNLSFYLKNGKKEDVEVLGYKVQLTSYGKNNKKVNSKQYTFSQTQTKEIRIDLVHAEPPQVIRVVLDFDRGRLERNLLVGYEKRAFAPPINR